MAGEMSALEYWELQQLINAKVPSPSDCSSCGRTGTVQIAAHLVTPVGTSLGGGVAIGAANYPQAMLLCLNCGFTRYFNVILLKGSGGQPVG